MDESISFIFYSYFAFLISILINLLKEAMKSVRYLLTIMFMLSCHFGFAQLTNEQNNKVINYISDQINSHSFKDSTAVYTYRLLIQVDEKSNSKPKIISNDSTFFQHLKSIDSLYKFSFRILMSNKKKMQFILPIVITIMGSDYLKNEISGRPTTDQIAILFRYGKEFNYSLESRTLFPLIVAFDKNVYH